MRCFLFLFLFCFMPYMVYGASGYDTAEQQQLITSMQSDVDLIRDKDIQKIRDYINSEDPEFINKISSKNEHEQIVQMRNWLAKKAFNYYYDKYMAELKQKSAEKTGREIKTRRYKGDFIEHHWWLDRGDLDKDKCRKDGFGICDYPDGFEEYEIMLQVYGNTRETENFTVQLYIHKDDVNNNSYKTFNITLSAHQSEGGNDIINSFGAKLFLDVVGFTEKYDEHHRWRNQEVADVRAGKYRKPTKKEKEEWNAKYKGSPFGELGTIVDNEREWQSSWLPDAAVTSFATDFEYNYSETK